MSQTKHDIIVQFSQLGLDQVNGSMKTFASTSGVATKSQDALGGALGQTQGAAIKLRSDIDKSEKTTTKANTTTGKYTQTQDKAASSTQSFAEKFRSNRGLIFSVTGIITAGIEAIGMFQNFQNALAKQHDAQDRLNALEREGITTGREYTQAQKDLDDANRSVTFALRIMALSMGDLIPFSLLLVNQFVNMRNASTAAKATQDALTASTNALNASTQATAGGGMAQIVTRAGQVTTGMGTMGTGMRGATTATEELFTSSGRLVTGFGPMGTAITRNTEFIGTRNSGLVGGMSALTLGMSNTEKQSGRFTDVFRRIGEGIRALPAHFTKAGSSIKGFFANFGTNMGKLPGLFKAAGSAVMGFGKTLLTAFISNPILGIITAIGVAISALIFDFGGFRTAINQAGVAIGNAIPPLKGLLEGIGAVMNGAFDAVAGFLGFETSAQKAAKAADALKEASLDPLIISLEKYLDLGNQFQNLNTIVDQFAAVRVEIMKLTDVVRVGFKDWVDNWNGVNNATTIALDNIKERSPQVQQAIDNLSNTMTFLEQNNIKAADSQRILTALWNQLIKVAGEDVDATKKNEEAKQELEKQIKLNSNTTSKNADTIRAMISAERDAERSGKNLSVQMSNAGKIITEYKDAVGLNVEENQKLIDSLLDHAAIVALVGNENVKVKDTAFDVVASLEAWRDSNEKLSSQAQSDFSIIQRLVSQNKIELSEVPQLIEAQKKENKELGEAIDFLYKNWLSQMDEAGKKLGELIDDAKEQGVTAVDVEKKIMEAEKQRRESIQLKAAELGIYNKIQGLTLETQENAIRLEEEHNKSMSKNRQTLEALAVARGLDYEGLKQNSAELVKYIMHNNLAEISIGDVATRLAVLKDAREQDQKATGLETLATEELAKALNINIPLQDASAKGIMALVQAHDDIHDAATIATDDILEWSSQLERNQAVEEATIEKLLQYAEIHGVDIPEAIRQKGIPAIKEYIERVLGLGDAAKKTAEEAKNAFNDLANQGSSAIEGLIKEDVLEGKGKAVKKILKEIGVEANSLGGIQPIIKIAAETVDFEDKINSIPELIATMFNNVPPEAEAGADLLINTFASSAQDELGNKLPAIGETINGLWNYVKQENAGASGTVLLKAFQEAINNPAVIAEAAKQGFIDPILLETGRGLGLLPGEIRPKMADAVAAITGSQPMFMDAAGNIVTGVNDELIKGADQAPGAMELLVDKYLGTAESKTQDATLTGSELGGNVLEGADQAAENAADPMENLVNKYLAPAKASPEPQQTGLKMGQDTATGVQTGVEPIPGIFNQAFIDASVLGGATLAIIIQAVQQTMSNMSTSVATYSNSMKVNFTTALNEMATALPTLNEAVVLAQQTMSTLSTSVSTYANSMMTGITTFTTQAIADLGLWDNAMETSQQTASTLSTSVATYTNSMKTNINSFATSAKKDLGTVETATVDLREEASSLSSSISTYMSSMTSKISSFASSAVSNFGKVGQAAAKAAGEVEQLKKAIDSLKDKTVTITVKYNVQGKPSGLQHGGTFIADEPTKISGVNVAETFPEIVNVIPLDPKEPNSPLNDITLNTPNITPNIPSLEGMPTTSAMGGGGSNVTVTGNLIATIQLPNGEAMAKVVKPYMLKGYSSII